MNELRSAGYLHVALVGLEAEKHVTHRGHAAEAGSGRSSARWGVCFALAVAFHAAGAAALLCALERGLRSGRQCAGDHDRSRGRARSPRNYTERNRRRDRSSRKPSRNPSRKSRLKRNSSCRRIRRLSRCRRCRHPTVEKPPEKKPKQKHASLPSAPSTAETRSERAAAPMPGANSRNPECNAELEVAVGGPARAQQALSVGGAITR